MFNVRKMKQNIILEKSFELTAIVKTSQQNENPH